jgi:ABC-2 type transport system permease protein
MQRDSAAWQNYNAKMQAYWEKRQMVQDTFALFSPSMNYETITGTITDSGTEDVMRPGAGGNFDRSNRQETDTGGTLGKVISNILALLLFPSVFFGLAYVRFMRMDVR